MTLAPDSLTGPQRLGRGWGWVVADGVLGVVVGLVSLVWPSVTLLALSLLLGIGLLVQGMLQVSAASRAASGTAGRGWVATLGVLAVVAGIVCLVHPGAGLFAIALGVAIWFVVAGVHEVTAGVYLRENRVVNLLLGLVTVVLGIVLVAVPGLALSTVAVVAGIFFIVRGFGEIGLGMNLRRLRAASR